MKRKSIFLLGTILAGAALVGGTFAAWAVTDNASPFNVTITPGTIETGDTKYVTLEYGTKELVNVEGLGVGDTVGPYRLGIKATTGGEQSFNKGEVDLSITGAANETLINFITVEVKVDEEVEEVMQRVTKVTLNGNAKTGKYYPTLLSGTEQILYFYFSLSSDARSSYETIKDQSITMTVDWNLKEGEATVSSTKLYFNNKDGWDNVHAYAFNPGESAPYPGPQMTLVKAPIWSIEVDNTYTQIVFNNGIKGDGELKTNDLTINRNSPYFDYSNTTATSDDARWTDAPVVTSDTNYYLVGVNDNWTMQAANKLTKLETPVNGYTYVLEDVAINYNDKVKILSTENVWYGESSYSDAPNYVISDGGGIYDIYFNPDKNTSADKYFSVQLDESAALYDTYTLDIGDWATDDAEVFVYSFKENDATVPTRAHKLSNKAQLLVPKAADKFILVRMKEGTTAFSFSGDNFYNQSTDLVRESGKNKLSFEAWNDGNNKSTFTWSQVA